MTLPCWCKILEQAFKELWGQSARTEEIKQTFFNGDWPNCPEVEEMTFEGLVSALSEESHRKRMNINAIIQHAQEILGRAQLI